MGEKKCVKEARLIEKYQPVDYSDSCSKTLVAREPLTVDELFDDMFCNFPWIVRMMLKLRDIAVKPLKLKTGATFRDRIIERNNEEIVVGSVDKHLSFWVSVYCSLPDAGRQAVAVSTVVKYHNIMGRLYFLLIWMFHKLIVSYLFKRALGKR